MTFFLRKGPKYAVSSLSALAGGITLYNYSTLKHQPPKKMQLPSYEATFSVPLKCSACVTDIEKALAQLPGVTSTQFSIPSRLVTITSTTAPSTLISTIQSTGRDAILRGSGKPDLAAVCILEVPPSRSDTARTRGSKYESPVRGLARLIQLSETLTLLDLTLTAVPEGRYRVSVRRTGDISRGSASLGDVYGGEEGGRDGMLGELEVDGKKRGVLVGEVGWRVWELVGRGLCVERMIGEETTTEADGRGSGGEAREEVVGVVARSAGVWENEKVVCGCSGKTVWEEREEMVGKGIV